MLHFGVFACVFAILLVYLFSRIWSNFHRARIIEDTPTATVRSAPQGYVELSGTAQALSDSQMVAPLTGTACVWYRYKIEEERDDDDSNLWREVESESSELPFVLEDGSGECLVDPRKAEVTPGVKKVWYGKGKWPAGKQERTLFGFAGKRYRYTEERIEAGPIYVIGWFDTRRSTDVPLREEVSLRLRNWKQDGGALKERFDWNRDGRIDAQEWQKARAAAQREVLQDRAKRSAEAVVSCVRAADIDGYPFLISASPQFELIVGYRRKARYFLLGFIVASLALGWLVLNRF